MSDAEERFIAAAVAPLGDNAEMQITAERELRGMMAGRQIADETLEEAGQRLGRGKIRGRWAVIAAVILSLITGGSQVFRLVQQRELIEAFVEMESPEEFPESFAKREATEEQRLLIADDAERLWRSHPDNPAYFADYCRFGVTAAGGGLPADFLQTVARIDPENGYFLFVAGTQAAKGSVDQLPGPSRKRGEPKPLEQWKIGDEARFEEALSLLYEAVARPKWESYRGEIARARLDVLEAPQDLPDQFGKSSLQTRLDRRVINRLSEVIAAKAEQCGQNGDREGLRKLARAWEELASRELSQTAVSLFDGLIIGGSIMTPVDYFRDAAGKLEDRELEEKFRNRREAFDLVSKQRRENPAGEARNETIEHHGSYLAAVAPLEQFGPSDAPAIQDEDLKPGRLADYALIDRGLALMCWMLLGLACLSAAVYRFRGGTFARQMSGVLSGLIRLGDHAAVFAGGILVPLICLLMVSRLTGFGARDWNCGLHGMTIPVGQCLATLVMMIGLPIPIARLLLWRRAGFLGQGQGRNRFGWAVVPLCLSATVVYGLSMAGYKADGRSIDGLSFGSGDFIDLDITEAKGLPRTLLFIATGGVAIGVLLLAARGVRALHPEPYAHARVCRRDGADAGDGAAASCRGEALGIPRPVVEGERADGTVQRPRT